jgi:hypothetical protein
VGSGKEELTVYGGSKTIDVEERSAVLRSFITKACPPASVSSFTRIQNAEWLTNGVARSRKNQRHCRKGSQNLVLENISLLPETPPAIESAYESSWVLRPSRLRSHG